MLTGLSIPGAGASVQEKDRSPLVPASTVEPSQPASSAQALPKAGVHGAMPSKGSSKPLTAGRVGNEVSASLHPGPSSSHAAASSSKAQLKSGRRQTAALAIKDQESPVAGTFSLLGVPAMVPSEEYVPATVVPGQKARKPRRKREASTADDQGSGGDEVTAVVVTAPDQAPSPALVPQAGRKPFKRAATSVRAPSEAQQDQHAKVMPAALAVPSPSQAPDSSAAAGGQQLPMAKAVAVATEAADSLPGCAAKASKAAAETVTYDQSNAGLQDSLAIRRKVVIEPLPLPVTAGVNVAPSGQATGPDTGTPAFLAQAHMLASPAVVVVSDSGSGTSAPSTLGDGGEASASVLTKEILEKLKAKPLWPTAPAALPPMPRYAPTIDDIELSCSKPKYVQGGAAFQNNIVCR